MTLQEFIDKYNGKFVEYHSYGTGAKNQCVDLANQYITEVLKLPAIIGTNAQDFPNKINSNDYEYIKNTPTGVPNAGDLVIFKSSDNVGHISIFVEGNANLFTSFDQNYPTGSPCKLVSHNYRNVLGWLHPKKEPMSDTMQIDKKTFEKLVRNSSQWDEVVKYLMPEADPANTTAEQLKNIVAGIRSRITDVEKQLAVANAEVENRKEQVDRLKDQIASLESLKNNLINEKNKLIADIQKIDGVYEQQLKDKQVVIDDYAKKLGEANIALAECQAKRDYFSVIKFGDLELIKWK